MTKYKTMDANEAVSRVAYKFTEVAGIYPITPASPMAEKVDVLSNSSDINFFGNPVKVVEMQSEAGAIAMVHGALQSGVLANTFTASQGLLLMIPLPIKKPDRKNKTANIIKQILNLNPDIANI